MNINLTIIGQAIAFAIFVMFCMKYVWPPITVAMADRKKKIAEGLDAADRAERDLRLAQERAADDLREGKQQAAAIIEQANKCAILMIEEAKELEQDVNRAREVLRAQVSVLAIAGAEKILEASVDQKAHAKLVEKLAAEL